MPIIKKIHALEILDSRGRPTIKTYCEIGSRIFGEASVPSGASTGLAEAHELRDGDPDRFGGLGCLKAVENVSTIINKQLSGKSIDSQEELDSILIDLDGTPQKSKLGANALLSVSLAFARAQAVAHSMPLYRYFSTLIEPAIHTLPRLTINLFSGGKHAGGQVPIQDLLIVPNQKDVKNSLNTAYRIYQAASDLCLHKYDMRALTADEGGLAPPFPDLDTMFSDAMASIQKAGFEPGNDVFLALDVAASHFYTNGHYQLGSTNLTPDEMIQEIKGWTINYPIISVEDGLSEDDWDNWPKLFSEIQSKALVLGDDFLCTNPDRIDRAIQSNASNALLLKVNQIGTLTEAANAYKKAKSAGWKVTISARSGETEDNWLADLAVGWQGDQIKIGSITQSERLAKYNRLLEIEKETNFSFVNWPNSK